MGKRVGWRENRRRADKSEESGKGEERCSGMKEGYKTGGGGMRMSARLISCAP